MLYTYSSENSSSELAVIKSAGYDEVFLSALLDVIANWKAIRLSSVTTSALPACSTYVHDFVHIPPECCMYSRTSIIRTSMCQLTLKGVQIGEFIQISE